MRVPAVDGAITTSHGFIRAARPVIEAREIDGIVVVLYDYQEFPRGVPARNLFGYSAKSGEEIWRAEDIGLGAADAYTNVLTESPLVVGNFAGYACTIELSSGKVTNKVFSK